MGPDRTAVGLVHASNPSGGLESVLWVLVFASTLAPSTDATAEPARVPEVDPTTRGGVLAPMPPAPTPL